eukprot:359941-Chlamydomonas_euryale.AAC.1
MDGCVVGEANPSLYKQQKDRGMLENAELRGGQRDRCRLFQSSTQKIPRIYLWHNSRTLVFRTNVRSFQAPASNGQRFGATPVEVSETTLAETVAGAGKPRPPRRLTRLQRRSSFHPRMAARGGVVLWPAAFMCVFGRLVGSPVASP